MRKSFIDMIEFDCKSDENCIYTKNEAIELVNEIFNEIENMVCKNCKHFANVFKDKKIGYCVKLDKNLPFDFGCNRFERKEDERD